MKPSVLIIDDDVHFSAVLKRSLERLQHCVESAANSEQALALCTEFKPQWIILDLRLENESGLGLIKSLLAATPTSKIVMLTGYASIPTAVEAVKLGAHNYLHKPATLQELIAAFDDGTDTEELGNIVDIDDVMSVEKVEWEHIQRVLNEHQGNISATARALNMHRRTLQRKLQKYAPR